MSRPSPSGRELEELDGDDSNWGGRPYMHDRTRGVLESLDFTDILERIKYCFRGYECSTEINAEGKRVEIWSKPDPVMVSLPKLDDKGNIVFNPSGEIVYHEVEKEIKPLINAFGEHDLLGLLTGIMHRNIAFGNIPVDRVTGADKNHYIERTCKPFGKALINLLMVNHKRYDIQPGSNHMTELYWIVMLNVEFILSQAVGNKGRNFVEKTVGETKTYVERGLQQGVD